MKSKFHWRSALFETQGTCYLVGMGVDLKFNP